MPRLRRAEKRAYVVDRLVVVGLEQLAVVLLATVLLITIDTT
jgi:hypothetical protein